MNHDTLNLAKLDIPYMETTEFGEYTIKIEHDDMQESPRDWDNLGTMVCFHNRYNLGDYNDHSHTDPLEFAYNLSGLYEDQVFEYLTDDQLAKCWDEIHKKYVILPLYLYDHSGITMSTTGFSCPWDSGQVGYIYVSLEDVRKEYNVKRVSKKMREKIATYLTNEVETYDQHLTGEVYGFNIEKGEENEHVDSCYGFFGYNDDYMISVIKDAIKYDITQSPQQTEMFNGGGITLSS